MTQPTARIVRLAATAWPYALLVVAGLFILLPKLGDFGLWDPWEPKYTEAVREMIERDSWVVPYYRDKVRLAKPILVYWGMIAGALAFGLNEFGVRIAGVFFAVASLLGVYYVIHLLRGRRAALLSALVLATMPQFFFISRQAMPDVYLFTSLGLCLLFFCLGLYGPSARRDLHFALSYVGFSLAVLAKGPIVAGVLVAGPLGLFACALIDWRRLRVRAAVAPWVRPVRRQVLLFLVILVVVAGPWHVAIVIEQGSQYLTYFILKHNIERTQDAINQSGASDFYVRALAFGLFPWSCFIPVALASLVGFSEPDLLKKRGLEVLLLIATAVTITGFSMSATKFAHYLAPALIPLAVLVGLTIDRLLETKDRAGARLAWVTAFLVFLLPALDLIRQNGPSLLISSFSVKSYVPEELAFGAYYRALLAAVGVLLLLSAVVRSRLGVWALVACSVLMANYASATFIPALTPHKTMKNLCDTWKAQARNGEPIGFYGDVKHGIFFYTDYTVEHLQSRAEFLEFMNPAKPAFSVVERTKIQPLEQEFRDKYPGHMLRIVDDSHFKYALLRAIPTISERDQEP